MASKVTGLSRPGYFYRINVNGYKSNVGYGCPNQKSSPGRGKPRNVFLAKIIKLTSALRPQKILSRKGGVREFHTYLTFYH